MAMEKHRQIVSTRHRLNWRASRSRQFYYTQAVEGHRAIVEHKDGGGWLLATQKPDGTYLMMSALPGGAVDLEEAQLKCATLFAVTIWQLGVRLPDHYIEASNDGVGEVEGEFDFNTGQPKAVYSVTPA